MALQTYLQRRRAKYWARIRIPRDLIVVFDGKTEFVRALGTADPRVARTRVVHVCAAAVRTFSIVRNPMIPEEVRCQIARDFYERAMRRDDLVRATIFSEKNDENRLLNEVVRELETRDLKAEIPRGDTQSVDHATRAMIELHRLNIAPDSNDFRLIAMAIGRAQLEVHKRQMERDNGDFGGRPTDPILNSPATQSSQTAQHIPQSSASDETILALFERFLSENPNRVKSDTLAQARKSVALFVECLPRSNFQAKDITKKEVREWKQLLEFYPIKAAEINIFKNKTIRETIELNRVYHKQIISKSTVNKHLSFLGGFCDWLVAHGWLDRSPIEGMLLKVDKDENAGSPFTSDQLNILFKSSLFKGCLSEQGWHRPGSILFNDHRYWVPLIALFSGMRLGEIAQLDVKSVRKASGVLLFDVNKMDGKTTKTMNSIRIVPVHSSLLELGVEAYLETVLKSGAKRLFPLLKANARGQIAGDYSRDFNRFLRKIGIAGVSFHSFRHGVADALRRAGHLDNEIALILGHSVENRTTARYRSESAGTVERRKAMIEAIAYEGVDLPKRD